MWQYRAEVVRVVDGDTLDLKVDLGFYVYHQVRVRLKGVDTPEIYGANACDEGHEASDFVRELCPVGQKVMIETEKRGKYGRWLADVYIMDEQESVAGSMFLNAVLISKGWEYLG